MSKIISIKEARKLLGKSSEGLTDDQVSEIITSLQKLADTYITIRGSKKSYGLK